MNITGTKKGGLAAANEQSGGRSSLQVSDVLHSMEHSIRQKRREGTGSI